MTRLNRTEIPLRLRRSRLLVLGDVMLDQTVFGQVARISPEAPIPVMRQENIRNQCGGAANTAMTLGALRIPTVLVGVVGTDTAAETLRQELRNNPAAANITANLVSETNRPTTIKQRFRSQGQQIFRLDHETIDSIAETTANTILDTVRRALPDCEAMIISDYAKGVLTPTMLETVIALAHAQQVLVVIDPAPQSLPYYRGADYLTPNRAELRAMIGEFPSSDPGLSTALSTTCQQYDLGGIVLTRSEEGMSLFCHKDNHSSDRGKHHYLSATVREVYDVTGA
ncbi:MAG: hypothetical protein HRT36_00345, partial [Alphaproteobacteria bacterium]|nr:hypothetical protein [Alphaproteobacteria bacterium]